jgi:hypothetical protein
LLLRSAIHPASSFPPLHLSQAHSLTSTKELPGLPGPKWNEWSGNELRHWPPPRTIITLPQRGGVGPQASLSLPLLSLSCSRRPIQNSGNSFCTDSGVFTLRIMFLDEVNVYLDCCWIWMAVYEVYRVLICKILNLFVAIKRLYTPSQTSTHIVLMQHKLCQRQICPISWKILFIGIMGDK